MSVQNRELLLKKCKCLIVEDTAYRLLSYDNNILPSLFDLNTDKVVIQFGSFSKIIAPGFRIGWICAPKEIISKLVAAKQYSDLHSNTIGQLIIYKYLTTENWQEHINTIKKHYKEKRDTMISAIDKYFPEGYSLIKPEGGMFLWLGYNEDKVDFYKVLEKSILKGVAVVPGGEFSVNHNLDNYVRLNFTHSTPEKIDEGIKILGQVLKEMMHPN
jgi:DNA-binding transcriptional MocR family regulator